MNLCNVIQILCISFIFRIQTHSCNQFFIFRCEAVSRSQRSLFAEFERQRSRLVQLVRWYDHQQVARGSELRRETEQIGKETRRRIYYRSNMATTERARLTHLLGEGRNDLFSTNTPKSSVDLGSNTHDKKRQVYGCTLPTFKAPVTKTSEHWAQMKTRSLTTLSSFKKGNDDPRHSLGFFESPTEQRNKINHIVDKCLFELEECNGDGYDHFLQTSEPNRNAQILAQQNINQNRAKSE